MSENKKGGMFILGLGALGVVYGDIGTSPLYTLRECYNPLLGFEYNMNNIFGILSLIFWALVFVVIIKYMFFIMLADNNGEGGIMSLLALIISNKNKKKKMFFIILIGLIGTALLLADGIITPAISVLSAMEGLETAYPQLTILVIPLVIIVLLAVFLIQKKGTGKIGVVFGPIMVVWFLSIGIFGLLFIIKAPQILQAINPYYAINFFIMNKIKGFLILGFVVLAITGAEALYADIGNFGKKPIKYAWFVIVFPCLLLNYFGQGAAVLLFKEKAIANLFYFIIPYWFLIPMLIISTFATVIASQALISGAFSLIHQAMQLGYVPKLKTIHTSHNIHGQIYVPIINYFLMISCIFLVITFKTSSALASAYGISVMGTMLCTTILFSYLIMKVWNWNKLLSGFLFLLFFIVDLSFLSFNLVKILTGGWFPILVASIFIFIMTTWKWGNTKLFEIIGRNEISLDLLINSLTLSQNEITRIKGTAFFMVGSFNRLSVLLHHVKHNKVLQERVFLISINFSNIPVVSQSDKIIIKEYQHGFYTISVNYGYMENPDMQEIIDLCNEKEYKLDIYQTSYYVGRIGLKIENENSKSIRKRFFRFMHKNSESVIDYFGIPQDRVIEVGTRIVI